MATHRSFLLTTNKYIKNQKIRQIQRTCKIIHVNRVIQVQSSMSTFLIISIPKPPQRTIIIFDSACKNRTKSQYKTSMHLTCYQQLIQVAI